MPLDSSLSGIGYIVKEKFSKPGYHVKYKIYGWLGEKKGFAQTFTRQDELWYKESSISTTLLN